MATGALVDRHRELADASAAVRMALGGEGCLVLARGETGIGKTRLLEAVVADLADAAAAVWAACWKETGVPPYWPWTQVLADCARICEPARAPRGADVFDLTAFLPDQDLFSGPGISAPEGEMSERLRLRFFDNVATFLTRVVEQRPLVLVIDDLQWADAASLRLLRFIGQRLRPQPIAILGSHRYPDVEADSPLAAELGELVRAARTLALNGLACDDARQLIRQTAGADPAERLLTSVHQLTGGNPLFITEIVRLLDVQGRLTVVANPDVAFPVPHSLRHVITQRLRHVRQPCRGLLSRASVLGEKFSVELLALVTGETEAELRSTLDEGIRAGLLASSESGQYRFSHGLVREALYADMSPSVRSHLHRQAGEAIEQRFRADLEPRLGQLAYHFRLSANDNARALDYTRRAGEQALLMLAYEDAATCFARAADLVAADDQVTYADLLLKHGEALLRAGDRDAAAAAFEKAARSARHRGDAQQLAQAALGLGAGPSGFEVPLHDQRQQDLLQEALNALGGRDSSVRARVLARLSVASSFARPAEERADLSREAIAVARRVGDKDALAYALSSYCDARAGPSHSAERLRLATEMVQLARRSGNREMELLGRRFRVVAHLELANVTAVDAEIEAFAHVAEALHMPLYGWYVPMWKGMRALMEGRLADSERLLARAREIGERGASRNAAVLTDAQHNLWLMESGRWAEACARMERYLDDPDRGPNVAGVLTGLLARTGQRARAQSLLTRMGADDFAGFVFEDTFALATLCLAADGAADLGDRDAAIRLYRLLTPYARCFGISGIGNSCIGSTSRFLGRLAHVLEHWNTADKHFRDALEDHRRAGATLLIAHTLRDRAALLADRGALGDREASLIALDEATAIYHELGLPWWIERAVTVRPTAEPVLTPRGPGGNTFRHAGGVWTLSYAGTEARVNDAKGLHVICRLLAYPGREFHVLDLMVPLVTRGTSPRGLDERLAAPGNAGEVIDATARAAYKNRLSLLAQDLEEAEEDSDVGRAEKLRAERDFLVAELSAAYGLAGRVRHTSDPAERARWTITKRIRTALRRIDEVHPALAHHLKNSLKTGLFCCYSPEQDTRWVL